MTSPLPENIQLSSFPELRLARTYDSRLMLMRLPKNDKYEIRFCPMVNAQDKSMITFDSYDSYEKAKEIFYKMVHIFGYWEMKYSTVSPVVFLHEPY